jgi:RimJ/RimL family protein N-acetyltransferase
LSTCPDKDRTARAPRVRGRDRAAFIELFASPEVGTYLGGPRPRDELERGEPEVPGRRPGFLVVDLDGAMIGTVMLERRNLGPPDRVRPASGEVDLGYMFLPKVWGWGYAAEACAAALAWFARALPGEPVVLCTQTANHSSMRLAAKLGFIEVERYEKFGAKQWIGVWAPVTPSGLVRARQHHQVQSHTRAIFQPGPRWHRISERPQASGRRQGVRCGPVPTNVDR